MAKRYVSIWFRHLTTDWVVRRNPELKDLAFVQAASERGRMIVKAASITADANGVHAGMVVADCKAIYPNLEVLDFKADCVGQLLHALAEWCIRYTPYVAIDMPDGLILDVSGCAHLWGGEVAYLEEILKKIRAFGYDIRAAIADTIGTAWAISRFGQVTPIVKTGRQLDALLPLPAAALRLDAITIGKLKKLGLSQVHSFVNMPRSALRRRFGQTLLTRLDQALGQEIEIIEPVCPIEPYQERLPSLEPIRTATGIEIALTQLLEKLCKRLADEAKGLRTAVFKCYRIDGNIQKIDIGTNKPSRNPGHLFRLFEDKIVQIEPALGIELFVLDAPIVEELSSRQDALWTTKDSTNNTAVAELLDRLAGKIGMNAIHRYLPAEQHWPERSIKLAHSLNEKPQIPWPENKPRPIQLLSNPVPIEVMVQIPDYPPILFHHKGNVHRIEKADGPERIEQEWWMEKGLYRDYYCVEDQDGARYWIFRSGSYQHGEAKWFLHGFFA
ncbi:MAG: DNA polymerase Y family protein [Pedobacter sp.]|nr:MAG: DNA polymerase Y family protein [Pedobacter sp.]